MRLLFLTNADVHQFGIAEALQGLSQALVRQGLTVYVYSSDPSAKLSPMAGGIPVEFGPLPAPRVFPSLRDVRPLLRFCQRADIDLIHCHNVYRPGWAARLVKRALGIPYVLTSHNDINPHTSARVHRFWVKRRCRMILRDAAMVTYLSEFMADSGRRLGAHADRSRTIPNGIDFGVWYEPTATPSGNTVLALGRLVKDKGFDTLIDAAAILRGRDISMSLILAGEGPERAHLIDRARALGLTVSEQATLPAGRNVVWFPGVVYGAAKRELFARSRFVTFPSLPNTESFGLVALEGMAAGRPVLASDTGSVREMLGVDNEQLTPAGDAIAWADQMGRLLADDELCRALGHANRLRSRRFDWDQVAREYIDVYEQALTLPASTRMAIRG